MFKGKLGNCFFSSVLDQRGFDPRGVSLVHTVKFYTTPVVNFQCMFVCGYNICEGYENMFFECEKEKYAR